MNLRLAKPEDAQAIAALIHRAFNARPKIDPPAPALNDDEEFVRGVLEANGGLVAEIDGDIVGSILFDRTRPNALGLRRVSVDPSGQNSGVASAMVEYAESLFGVDEVWLTARAELPKTIEFWIKRGYAIRGSEPPLVELAKPARCKIPLPDLEDTEEFAKKVAVFLKAGDVVILTGDLGAGKTTFTQFLGAALGVRGPITSPTFVIARTHPSLVGGPALVHVDAYRMGSAAEFADLDLDISVDDSVTVVEWGEGMAEQLSDSWLHISFSADREATVNAHGPRWLGVPVCSGLSR